MLAWLEYFLVRYPELALFLVIAAGYWIGSFKIRAFSLGPVTGALFAGLLVGQFAHVPVSAMTQSFLFLLFLFGIGYSVGPQFMQAMKRDGLKPVLVALVVCFTGLAAAIFIAKALRLDPGFSAGLMSGSLTQSSVMGTATDAINALPLPQADRARFVAHIAVAHAICYTFGYAGVIIFLSMIAPALLKIDLRTEALTLEQSLGMTRAKAAMQNYILRSWSLVKLGTTVKQKKLFFSLAKAKCQVSAFQEGDLHPNQVALIAKGLCVTEQDVVEMNRRLRGDVSLNIPLNEDGDSVEWQDRLLDEGSDQETRVAESEELDTRRKALHLALTVLDDCERQIFEARRLLDPPPALAELATKFGLSRERIRQIEYRAFQKVRRATHGAMSRRRRSLNTHH
jgi:RNA polymerase sigma factor (sigma-70 family)